MGSADHYFGSKHFSGMGKLFYLKVLRIADPDTSSRRLLGSIVEEGDEGFLGTTEYPFPLHYFTPEIVLQKMIDEGIGVRDELVFRSELAPIEYNFSGRNEISGSAKGEFPCLPASLGLAVDYKRIEVVTLIFGDQTNLYYIGEGFLKQLHQKLNGDGTRITEVMDRDKMIVDRILVSRNHKVMVTSRDSFDTKFEARATELSGVGGEVKFSRLSEKKFVAEVTGDHDYLVALNAVQWENLA